MKKLFGILAIILLLFGSLGSYIYYASPTLLANIISKKTQTPVSIHSIDWKKDRFKIFNLSIANPKKSRIPTAMNVKKIEISNSYLNYLKNPIIIDQITLDSVYINIEIYNKAKTEGNWQTLLDNLKKDHKEFFSIERQALIKKLVLTNIKIDVILSDGKVHNLSPIKRLEFDNIESDKGIPSQEITEIIMQKMIITFTNYVKDLYKIKI